MELVKFGSDLPAYEIGDRDAAAVIVIQEWWGLTDVLKDVAQKLHRLGGFRVLLPDLYKGKIGVDKEEAKHLMSELGWEKGTDEIKQAVKYLRQTGSKKIGLVGFGMGGALAFCAAEHAGVDCAVAFYGTPPPSACEPTSIKVPIQTHFGKLDTMVGFSDPKTASLLEQRMKDAGIHCEFIYYDGAGHAFMNEGEAGDEARDMMGYPHPSPEVREEAWKHTMDFFAEKLATTA